MTPSLCVAVDLSGYRDLALAGQRRAQADLVALLEGVWPPADHVRRQPHGDGEVAVLASQTDPSELLSRLRDGLVAGLADLRAAGRPLRVRVAVHLGHVEPAANGFAGHAVVRVCRMVGSDALRAALADHPDSDLVLLVSDPVVEDVVGRERHGLRTADFRPLDVDDPAKDFRARAWLHVPGTGPASGDRPARRQGYRVDVAAGGRVGTVVQIGELHGPLWIGLPPEGPR